ncbi:MarR family transcriptional regulator [Longispora sp. K20-0274]|uniref:MarR family winged helix-turn-helix transcriptional regulator n=1 Tax=Longispora sp. K20-0274 TaxID=3088255 RepID=UPI00399A55A7
MVRPTDNQARLAATLRQSIMRLNRSLRRARPISELTPSQLSALTSLDLAGALTPRELADTERVQPPTMTKVIAKLEELGLVQRTPHPTDGRQVILATTETARGLLGDNQRARDAWLAERLAELTADEREALSKAAELLERIARS